MGKINYTNPYKIGGINKNKTLTMGTLLDQTVY